MQQDGGWFLFYGFATRNATSHQPIGQRALGESPDRTTALQAGSVDTLADFR
jgi:hypothetical protein